VKTNSRLNKSARLAGVLFILATASGVVAAAIRLPIEEAPDWLMQFNTHSESITLSAFLIIMMAFACTGVGLALFPILKNYSEDFALAVAGFRLLESGSQIIIAASTMGILALSKSTELSISPADIEVVASSFKAASGWLGDGPMLLAWSTAAVLYYAVFYRYKLVPHWLSGWGLAGISLTVIFSLMNTLGFQSEINWLPFVFNLPIAIQELVFAAWLIFKGINISNQLTKAKLATSIT
jgi:hypothetical protein